MEIVPASTDSDLDSVRRLMRMFVDWHFERHHEYRDLIERYFDSGAFEAELAGLPGVFVPPGGALLVARIGEKVAGCVALRDLGDGACEMKRLFVDPAFHGKGIGLALAQAVIAEARRQGYTRMFLDTGPKQVEAQGLYRRLGFNYVPPYSPVSDDMRDWLVYMELTLAA